MYFSGASKNIDHGWVHLLVKQLDM